MGVLVDIVPNHVGVADPALNAWWWDVLPHGPDSTYARRVRHRLGRRRRPVRLPVLGDDESATWTIDAPVDGELRYYDHRFPIAPGTGDGDAARGARPAALRAGRLAARRRRAELPPVLRDHHAGRRPGRGPDGVRRERTPRSGAGATTAWSTGCAIDHPDGLRRPRRLPATTCAELTGGALRAGREDPRAGRGRCRGAGRATAPPATTRWPTSTGCSSTRPARRRWTRSTPQLRGARRSTGTAMIHATQARASPTGSCGPRCGGWRATGRAAVPDRGPRTLRDALAELLACFPVYRTYLPTGARAPRRGARRGPAEPPARPRPRRRPCSTPVLRDPGDRAGACGSSRPRAW